jgi:hypothetical protein
MKILGFRTYHATFELRLQRCPSLEIRLGGLGMFSGPDWRTLELPKPGPRRWGFCTDGGLKYKKSG